MFPKHIKKLVSFSYLLFVVVSFVSMLNVISMEENMGSGLHVSRVTTTSGLTTITPVEIKTSTITERKAANKFSLQSGDPTSSYEVFTIVTSNTDAQFINPYDVKISSTGLIYVSDACSIKTVDPNTYAVSLFLGSNVCGYGPGQVNNPTYMAFDPNGVLYFVDQQGTYIRYNSTGSLISDYITAAQIISGSIVEASITSPPDFLFGGFDFGVSSGVSLIIVSGYTQLADNLNPGPSIRYFIGEYSSNVFFNTINSLSGSQYYQSLKLTYDAYSVSFISGIVYGLNSTYLEGEGLIQFGLRPPVGVAFVSAQGFAAAVDSSGNLYVTSSLGFVFEADSTGSDVGDFGTAIPIVGDGANSLTSTSTSTDGLLSYEAYGITLDANNDVFIADYGNNALYKAVPKIPTQLPTSIPTVEPSLSSIYEPTCPPVLSEAPVIKPTHYPTHSKNPSVKPTHFPTDIKAPNPTHKPSYCTCDCFVGPAPTHYPTHSKEPIAKPTHFPTT